MMPVCLTSAARLGSWDPMTDVTKRTIRTIYTWTKPNQCQWSKLKNICAYLDNREFLEFFRTHPTLICTIVGSKTGRFFKTADFLINNAINTTNLGAK